MNYKKLQAAVQRSGMKRGFLAEKMGISDQVMSDRISGKSPWKVPEAAAFCEVLGLSKKERDEIFFGQE